ncbi:hypothetical protein FKM82_028572 [Ascaphus truei]
MEKQFKTITKEYSLMDIWRIQHQGQKDYTFYSAPHQSYSRIDYFFATKYILEACTNSDLGPITWSDHAPITLTLSTPFHKLTAYTWKLNDSLLNHPEVKKEIKKALREYFALNWGIVDSPAVLWEAHRAAIRGTFISIASHRKAKVKLITDLTTKIIIHI